MAKKISARATVGVKNRKGEETAKQDAIQKVQDSLRGKMNSASAEVVGEPDYTASTPTWTVDVLMDVTPSEFDRLDNAYGIESIEIAGMKT